MNDYYTRVNGKWLSEREIPASDSSCGIVEDINSVQVDILIELLDNNKIDDK